MNDEEVVLRGGVANAGRVTRAGPHVLRPAGPHTPSLHRFLSALPAAGFGGAPLPVGIEPDGRERLTFIPGRVGLPPYPEWVQGDEALASIVRLLAAFHSASASVDTTSCRFSAELADPVGGPLVCHNDVCPENVVFDGETAVGLLDFDFAAPGRPAFDLAQCARMCIPVDDDETSAMLGWRRADRPARLRVAAEAYGLDGAGRAELLRALDASIATGGAFVRRRVQAGDRNFIAMWQAMGGDDRFDRRRRWWSAERGRFRRALR